MKIKLIDALPGAGKTRAEVAYILNSTHNRFLYTCKGTLQIDSLTKDFEGTDVVFTSFYKDDSFGSITEEIEKYVSTISDQDSRKHVVVITHKAFDTFRSVQFFNDKGFVQSYDELNDAVIELSVKWDSHTNSDSFYTTDSDGNLRLNAHARSMLSSDMKFRAQHDSVKELIKFIKHPRYNVRTITSKELKEQDAYIEYYQAIIKENYFLNDTRILSYGVVGSTTHKYIESQFTNTTLTTEILDYDPRGNRITVIPFTESANSSYLQTDPTHKIMYDKMMHAMFQHALQLVKETNGAGMSYTNKRHESIAGYYEGLGLTHLPIYLHGLQTFKHCNVLVNTFVANRSPEAVLGLTQLLDVSTEEALRERSNHALIQSAHRGLTRDYSKTNQHMYIICVSLDDAEHIKATLPNVDIDTSVIESGEYVFKASRKIVLTATDSNKISSIKSRIKKKDLVFPLHVTMIVNQFSNLKGSHFKEALTKAGIWDNFTTKGVWK